MIVYLTKSERHTPAISSAAKRAMKRYNLVVIERNHLTDSKKECVLMEKKFVLNRVDLGQRVIGYEIFNPGVNGGEVIGMTVKQLSEAVKAGEVLGMLLDGNGILKLDEARGFRAIMVKTGVGTLTSTDPSAVANLMYTVYRRDGENYKVISSRFGRQIFCEDKIKALIDLGAVNGVILDGKNIKSSREWTKKPKGQKGKK